MFLLSTDDDKYTCDCLCHFEIDCMPYLKDAGPLSVKLSSEAAIFHCEVFFYNIYVMLVKHLGTVLQWQMQRTVLPSLI